MNELDTLLDGYEQRKRNEATAQQASEALHNEYRIKAIRLFDAVILPVAREFEEAIRARGHSVETKERLGPSDFPSIAIDLSLKDSPRYTSQLSFSHMPVPEGMHERIMWRQQVDSPDNTRNYESNGSWLIAEMNEAIARERIVKFVEATLRAH